MRGSEGPSGLDANEWRMILTCFDRQSTDLCRIIGKLAVKIATEMLDFLYAYALDANPGVMPIGIDEVPSRDHVAA